MLLPGHLIIAGDFNYHMDEPRSSHARQLADILESMNLVQHVTVPTHKRGHPLDLIITAAGDSILTDFHVEPPLLSDHSLLICRLDSRISKPSRTVVRYRRLNSIDRKALPADIAEGFSQITNCSPEDYNNVLTSVLDQHAPFITRVTRTQTENPWYNEVIHKERLYWRKLERRWLQTDTEIHRLLYLEQCHAVAGLITQAKIEYYRERLGSASAKDAFRFVNSLFRKMNAGMQSSESNKTLADKFATFFEQTVNGIRTGLDSVGARHLPLTGDPLMPSPLESFTPTSEQQLSKIIRASPNKSCSLDPIPTWLLKEQSILQGLAPALVSCINASFTSGDVPEFLKTAMVKPLLKKSGLDQRELRNYRPVSNLSFLIKVMEKIVTSQIVEHMNTHELFHPYQSAYRSGHSTETALLKIKNDIELALDCSEGVLMVLLDLSAAFDTIDHAILLDRLKSRIGISGAALQWLKSYLSNRTFRTVPTRYT